MAPDKIYLQVCGSCDLDETCENCKFAELLEGGGVTWSEDRIYEKDEEYIRKGALLDKLNLALKLRTGDNPDINTDGVQTIKAMINYIESL